MATVSGINYHPGQKISLNSSTDYSAAVTNVFVTITADNEITRSTANQKAIGVMVNKPAEDEQAEIILNGTAPVVCGGVITRNDYVKTDSLGELDVADTDKDEVVGRAMQSGVDGDIIEVELIKFKASI